MHLALHVGMRVTQKPQTGYPFSVCSKKTVILYLCHGKHVETGVDKCIPIFPLLALNDFSAGMGLRDHANQNSNILTCEF